MASALSKCCGSIRTSLQDGDPMSVPITSSMLG
jgi:hypothetical protein